MTRTLTNNAPKTPKTSTSSRRRRSVMTRRHPRWREFVCRLAGPGPEGIDFTVSPGFTHISSRCAGGWDTTYARKLLTRMRGVDVERSLAYFEKHGGCCDCKIVLNVDLFRC